ncbi:MAG: efflux RND transporter periplasmic adaptor subunit, partial [Pseudomonadota bacterium]
GQTVEIVIAAEGAAAHLIPPAALTLDNSGTMGLRIVDDTNTTRFVPVQVIRDTTEGFLVTGLPDEARVIVRGQEFVTDGVTVRPVLEGDRS